MESMLAQNPMYANNPMLRQSMQAMMQNPEMMEQALDPERMRALLQTQRAGCESRRTGGWDGGKRRKTRKTRNKTQAEASEQSRHLSQVKASRVCTSSERDGVEEKRYRGEGLLRKGRRKGQEEEGPLGHGGREKKHN